MRRVIERMHMREVTIAYGMTETSPVSFQSSPDDPLERRVTTVGPHPAAHGSEGRSMPEGKTVPRGEAGRALHARLRRDARLLGRSRRKPPKRSTRKAGCTPAISAVIDDEGYCNIVGRSKDMIIRGGENVYPREIEEFLFRHPKVADVAVVGVP